MAMHGVKTARKQGSCDDAMLIRWGTGLQDVARDANGARGTVGNASRVGFVENCVECSPECPRSAPLNACSRESHLSGISWPTLPRTMQGQPIGCNLTYGQMPAPLIGVSL